MEPFHGRFPLCASCPSLTELDLSALRLTPSALRTCLGHPQLRRGLRALSLAAYTGLPSTSFAEALRSDASRPVRERRRRIKPVMVVVAMCVLCDRAQAKLRLALATTLERGKESHHPERAASTTAICTVTRFSLSGSGSGAAARASTAGPNPSTRVSVTGTSARSVSYHLSDGKMSAG